MSTNELDKNSGVEIESNPRAGQTTPFTRSADRKVTIIAVGLTLLITLGAAVALIVAPPPDVSKIQIPKESVKATNAFGLRVFSSQVAEDPSKNVLVSPTAARLTNVALYNGTAGETRKSFESILQFQGEREVINDESTDMIEMLRFADPDTRIYYGLGLWGNHGIGFRRTFDQRMKLNFGSEAKTSAFSHVSTSIYINEWSTKVTRQLGPLVLDESLETKSNIDPRMLFFSSSVLYVNGQWRLPKAPELVHKTFAAADEPVEMEVLDIRGSFLYEETELGKMVRVPYASDRLALYALLPAEGESLTKVAGEMDEEWIETHVQKMKRSPLSVLLPTFRVEYEFDLVPRLRAEFEDSQTSTKDVFSDEADWSELFKDNHQEAYPDKMLQVLVFVVNQNGPDAERVWEAVKQEGGASESSAQVSELAFLRPFVYFVRDDLSGLVVVAGTMNHPKKPNYPPKSRAAKSLKSQDNQGKQ